MNIDINEILAKKLDEHLKANEDNKGVEVDVAPEEENDIVTENDPVEIPEENDEGVITEEKAHHAFIKLRKEKQEIKKAAIESEKQLEELKSLFGAESVDELLDYFKNEGVRIAAQSEGKSTDILKQELDAKRHLEELKAERERMEAELAEKKVQTELETFARKYGLDTADEFNKMIDALMEAGLDIDTLKEAKNPQVLIKGAVADLLLEKTKQAKAKDLVKSRETRTTAHETKDVNADVDQAKEISKALFAHLKDRL